nr:MAG TPA: hypothetical protein [Bacteriophage sp.]
MYAVNILLTKHSIIDDNQFVNEIMYNSQLFFVF